MADTDPWPSERLAIYDMDKTLTSRPSWVPWLFFFARTEAPWRLLLAPLMLVPSLGFALGVLDRKGLKEATQRIMMGRRVVRERVMRAADRFADLFGRRAELRDAVAALQADKAAGYRLVMATASSEYYAASLARRWGFDEVVATRNRWDGDWLTPEILGENCYEMGKMRMVLAQLEGRPARTRFVSDHVSDMPMLLWADEAVAANASTALRLAARSRGWISFDWRR